MKKILAILFFASIISCNPDPDPNANCELINQYKIGYNAIDASAIYDIRKTSPLEIRNGKIEYNLFYQAFDLFLAKKYPFPLNEYFIDYIEVSTQNKVIIYFSNSTPQQYELVKNECLIELLGTNESIPGELKNGGKEIYLDRFAIYDHNISSHGQDTFTFIEFRNALNKNYFEIIKEFANANPGKYDTIAIEKIINSTKEY